MNVNIEANNNDAAVVTANIPAGAHMDAAIAGEIAGIELEVSRSAIRSNTERSERRAALTLTLDMTPGTMRDLAYLLVDKLKWPAFRAPEWLEIAAALRANGQLEFADRIWSAYALPEGIERVYVPDERLKFEGEGELVQNTQARLDAHILDEITNVLSGNEWGADTNEAVAALVRMTGREIKDYDA